MAESNNISVGVRVANGVGFSIGSHQFGRLDRWADNDLETLHESTEGLIGEAGVVLEAIGLIQEARYNADTAARKGQYAIE